MKECEDKKKTFKKVQRKFKIDDRNIYEKTVAPIYHFSIIHLNVNGFRF